MGCGFQFNLDPPPSNWRRDIQDDDTKHSDTQRNEVKCDTKQNCAVPNAWTNLS
jgi:hypothetical protein